jgi:hypothetical protein
MPTDIGIFVSTELKDLGYSPVFEDICDFLAGFFTPSVPLIDIGAGLGYYSKCMVRRGFQCVAIDGSEAAAAIGAFPIHVCDLTIPQDLPKGQVLCLEVGEHIPAKYEDTFLGNLLHSAQNRMVLSWAIAGQPGLGHVNCHDNFWVIERLRREGWGLDVGATEHVRRIKFGVYSWFKQSILCFTK